MREIRCAGGTVCPFDAAAPKSAYTCSRPMTERVPGILNGKSRVLRPRGHCYGSCGSPGVSAWLRPQRYRSVVRHTGQPQTNNRPRARVLSLCLAPAVSISPSGRFARVYARVYARFVSRMSLARTHTYTRPRAHTHTHPRSATSP